MSDGAHNNILAPLLNIFAQQPPPAAAPPQKPSSPAVVRKTVEQAIPARHERLGRIIAASRAQRLARYLLAWRQWVLSSELARSAAHVKGTYAAVHAAHDKTVASNERWKAREKAKLDATAKQIDGERVRLERAKRELKLEADAMQRRGDELEANLSAKRREVAQVGGVHGARRTVDAMHRLCAGAVARYYREWRSTVEMMRAEAQRASLEATCEELRGTIARLEARPLKGQEGLQAERRARLAAEESAKALELTVARMQRQVRACRSPPHRRAAGVVAPP